MKLCLHTVQLVAITHRCPCLLGCLLGNVLQLRGLLEETVPHVDLFFQQAQLLLGQRPAQPLQDLQQDPTLLLEGHWLPAKPPQYTAQHAEINSPVHYYPTLLQSQSGLLTLINHLDQ